MCDNLSEFLKTNELRKATERGDKLWSHLNVLNVFTRDGIAIPPVAQDDITKALDDLNHEEQTSHFRGFVR